MEGRGRGRGGGLKRRRWVAGERERGVRERRVTTGAQGRGGRGTTGMEREVRRGKGDGEGAFFNVAGLEKDREFWKGIV